MPLTPDQILTIARAAEAADGAAPLDEATQLTLRHHPERVESWGDERGFGLLVGEELSLVVAPDQRGAGVGSGLLDQRELPATATAWSHGDHPAARALAASHGWERARELWVMRRPLEAPEIPATPDGIVVRGYRPDDAPELLRVNAAAFAHHPEQGGMDAANLAERMAEPWFDPEGLVMAWSAEEPSRLLGFHWTKRHSATEGEVYVVGIDPDAQGRGLGRLLTAAGLGHLHAVGVRSVHLYVEGDNTPAVRLYEGQGFTRAETHVQYRR